MSRAYRAVRPRANRVYSVELVMNLYDVCRNTVSNWVGSGLNPVDARQPQLFRGTELSRFHTMRRNCTSRQLRAGEFKCLTCKAAVFPLVESLGLEQTPKGAIWAVGACPDCKTPVHKILNDTECNKLQDCIDTNTSLCQRDEEEVNIPVGIGKVKLTTFALQSANDRTIFAWQIYAGRFDTKTVDAYLTSVRDFEGFLAGKLFENVTPTDADNWRRDLIGRARKASNLGGQSRSTLQHRAAHLKSFFSWLSGLCCTNQLMDGVPLSLDRLIPRFQ